MRSTWTALLAAASILLLAACGNGDDTAGGNEAAAGGGATISVESSELGEMVVDAEGRTLYAFLPDDQGASTCYDDCAATWPALVLDRGDPTAGDGVDAELLGTIEREDGTLQVTYGVWPLYHFANDETADDVNGQGVGDVWYVVSPDGSPLQDAGTAKGGGYGMG